MEDETIRRGIEEMWEKANAVAQWIRPATKPLVRAEGKRIPSLVGGSILVRAGKAFCFFTARHVIEEFEQGPINFMSPPVFAGFRGRKYWTTVNAAGHDPNDAAVMVCEDDVVTDEMREAAISPQLFAPPTARHSPFVLVLGFPASRYANVSGRQVIPNYLQWSGTMMTDDELRERGHDPARHVGMDFDPKLAIDQDVPGRRGPKMSGVSGSGMWLLPALGSRSVHGSTARLVGIFTEQLPLKRPTYFLGTYIGVHVAMLLHHRPDLKQFF